MDRGVGYRYDRKTKKWVDTSSAYAGHLRLHVDRCDVEVISHEAVHAAAHIWRLDGAGPDWRVDLGDDCTDDEEDFAYLVSGITQSVVGLLNAMTREDG